MKNTFAVIGLGTFGSKLALELSQAGHSVVAIDRSKTIINDIKDKVTEALIADLTNPDTVKEIDVQNFDAIILGMSSHFEDLILTLTLIKQEGAKKIIAKANTDLQKRILLRLGADEVIQPEQAVAERLSKRLSMSNISDNIETLPGQDKQREFEGQSPGICLDLTTGFSEFPTADRHPRI